MRVYHLTNDLMLSSQAANMARRQGVEYAHGATLNSVFEAPETAKVALILWDLGCQSESLAQAVGQLHAMAPPARVVAYAPHVHEDRLAAARAAGCDEVLSRGQFSRELARLLAGPSS